MNEANEQPTPPEPEPGERDDPEAGVPDPGASTAADGADDPAIPWGQPAELDKRFLAAVLDGLIAFVLGFLPVFGWLLALAYWLIRDGLEAEFMDQRSVGKKLMKIRPLRSDGAPTDITDSIRRNWMFSITGIIQYLWFVPFGFLLAVPLSIILIGVIGVEVYLIVTEPDGRRLGDRFAGTVVVEVDR